jgi:hypothetical protein
MWEVEIGGSLFKLRLVQKHETLSKNKLKQKGLEA